MLAYPPRAKIQFILNERTMKIKTRRSLLQQSIHQTEAILKEVIQSEGFLENIEDIPAISGSCQLVELEQEVISLKTEPPDSRR